jgi:hypothetical protein
VHHEIRDQAVHNQLQADLVEHMWVHVATMLQTTTMKKIPKKTMPRPFVSFYIFI